MLQDSPIVTRCLHLYTEPNAGTDKTPPMVQLVFLKAIHDSVHHIQHVNASFILVMSGMRRELDTHKQGRRSISAEVDQIKHRVAKVEADKPNNADSVGMKLARCPMWIACGLAWRLLPHLHTCSRNVCM